MWHHEWLTRLIKWGTETIDIHSNEISKVSIILRVEINSLVSFVMYKIVLWMSLLTYVFVWVFVMSMFVRMTIHIRMGFHHVHICTDDYPFLLNSFPSCKFLYGWLPYHFEWIFVIYISVRMTTISFWMDCRHLHFCTNDSHLFLLRLSSFTFLYELLPFLFIWFSSMHISVRMTTISLCIYLSDDLRSDK